MWYKTQLKEWKEIFKINVLSPPSMAWIHYVPKHFCFSLNFPLVVVSDERKNFLLKFLDFLHCNAKEKHQRSFIIDTRYSAVYEKNIKRKYSRNDERQFIQILHGFFFLNEALVIPLYFFLFWICSAMLIVCDASLTIW